MSTITQPRTLLGVLTPSSNTRLEPLTSAFVSAVPGASAHFGRFRVVDVGLGAQHQFDPAPVVAAAELLADARVGAITWSGTSGGWRGVAADHALCTAITAATGVPCTTSLLALFAAMERLGRRRVALVSPYPDDMHAAVIDTFTGAGLDVIADANDGFTASNWELSTMPADTIEAMVADVARARPDAIVPFCTNLVAAGEAAAWEEAYGVPILDSITLAAWHGLELAGHSGPWPGGWGRFFADPSSRGSAGQAGRDVT